MRDTFQGLHVGVPRSQICSNKKTAKAQILIMSGYTKIRDLTYLNALATKSVPPTKAILWQQGAVSVRTYASRTDAPAPSGRGSFR